MTILSRERRASLTAQAGEYERELGHAESYLLDRGISMEAARMFHLGAVLDGEYAGRLSIPYHTPAGVVAQKFRCMGHHDCKTADCVKYLYPPGTGLHLYNAQVLITAVDTVVVTEGELDAICVQAYCGLPAVAYPGADTFRSQSHWRLCFEGVSEVVVVADGDKVGHQAAAKVSESIGTNARVATMPASYDANLFIHEKGANAFLDLVTH